MNQPTDKVVRELAEGIIEGDDNPTAALIVARAYLASRSAARVQEGYPGIAHDFETMRSALVQIRDECFNGHAHDIAEAALNAAPQRSTAKDSTGPSQEGLGQGDAAVAAPASSERSQLEGWCPACKGSGTMKGMTHGHGPDDYEIDVECSECKGTGAGPSPEATATLFKKHNAELKQARGRTMSFEQLADLVERQYKEMAEHAEALEGVTSARPSMTFEQWWDKLAEEVKDCYHRGCEGLAARAYSAGQKSPESATSPSNGPLTLDTERQVFFYEQDHYYLSNFSAFTLGWRGLEFPTSEHAYQWDKFPHLPELQDLIRSAPSAHAAFKLAERNKDRVQTQWPLVKMDVMLDILRAKATQHEYVRRKLLQTGDRELIEHSWRDAYWGWGPNRDGKNMLGMLWMTVRAELRARAEGAAK